MNVRLRRGLPVGTIPAQIWFVLRMNEEERGRTEWEVDIPIGARSCVCSESEVNQNVRVTPNLNPSDVIGVSDLNGQY